MSRKVIEVLLIFCIMTFISIRFYRVIKGYTASLSEFIIVLLVALIISSIVSIIYLKIKKKNNKTEK